MVLNNPLQVIYDEGAITPVSRPAMAASGLKVEPGAVLIFVALSNKGLDKSSLSAVHVS